MKQQPYSCCDVPAAVELGEPSGVCSEKTPAATAAGTESGLCPVSATTGLKVDLITLKALLTGDGLRRLNGEKYRFCPAADCDVVYFDNAANSVFRPRDLTVRIGLKETADSAPICYCFGYTTGDVRRDFATFGTTEIPTIITAEVKAGHCGCEVRNPQGSCCLGNVSRAVRPVPAELADALPNSRSESGAERVNP